MGRRLEAYRRVVWLWDAIFLWSSSCFGMRGERLYEWVVANPPAQLSAG